MKTDAQTATFMEDFLSHFGVKGMRWGQRISAARTARADKKFEKKTTSFNKFIEVHNAAGDHFNARIGALNDKHTQDFSKEDHANPQNWSPAYKSYNKDVAELSRQSLEHAVSSLPSNKSGTRKVKLNIIEEEGQPAWHLSTEKIEHAADTTDILVVPKYASNGKVVSVEFKINAVVQGALVVEDGLKHYGIKGMQWGRSTKTPTSATVTQKGKKLKTKGGQGQPAHADAVKKAAIGRTKKKSGTNSLSDAQLKSYANRLELEQRVKRLESGDKSAGRRFVRELIGARGKQAANEFTSAATTQQVNKALNKTGVKKS